MGSQVKEVAYLPVSSDWLARLLGLLAYCFPFANAVRTGLYPGPKDSKQMSDRVIRAAGGIFVIVALLGFFFA